ncbi:MAG: hypothetical protein KDB63_21505 [Nocardioidaceae bacterium]|nr:hypothetical protein [Nocardioidaceae bacterium]
MTRPDEVLAQLDAAQADFRFPDLNHSYYFAIDCRLHAFGDGTRWALVVETVGYNPRGANVYDVVHYFGNCLTSGQPGFENEDFLARIENMEEIEDADEPETFSGAAEVRVRDQDLQVHAEPGADLIDVFRALVHQHRELLLATEDEVRRRIPADIPKLLQLDEWHQPDLFDVLPSDSELYAQLADVVAAADPTRYRPTEPPNTHWSNWPESGSL